MARTRAEAKAEAAFIASSVPQAGHAPSTVPSAPVPAGSATKKRAAPKKAGPSSKASATKKTSAPKNAPVALEASKKKAETAPFASSVSQRAGPVTTSPAGPASQKRAAPRKRAQKKAPAKRSGAKKTPVAKRRQTNRKAKGTVGPASAPAATTVVENHQIDDAASIVSTAPSFSSASSISVPATRTGKSRAAKKTSGAGIRTKPRVQTRSEKRRRANLHLEVYMSGALGEGDVPIVLSRPYSVSPVIEATDFGDERLAFYKEPLPSPVTVESSSGEEIEEEEKAEKGPPKKRTRSEERKATTGKAELGEVDKEKGGRRKSF